MQPNKEHFMGANSFIWWFGVVEDRTDPKGFGRVRVRIVGHHSQDKKDIPTADLPWAYPILPFTSASVKL